MLLHAKGKGFQGRNPIRRRKRRNSAVSGWKFATGRYQLRGKALSADAMIAKPAMDTLKPKHLAGLRSWIFDAAIKGKPYFIADMISDVYRVYGKSISKTTMRRVLRHKLCLRYSRIRSHGTKVETERILKLVKSYLDHLEKPKPAIESGQGFGSV